MATTVRTFEGCRREEEGSAGVKEGTKEMEPRGRETIQIP